jgi:opacity protein-like surface antigen
LCFICASNALDGCDVDEAHWMSCLGRKERLSALVLLWNFTFVILVNGADGNGTLPLKAASELPSSDWTGFYIGGHFGYGTGRFGSDTNAEPLQGAFFPHSVTGMIGGYQAGHNWEIANRLVVGVEADISYGSPVDIPRLAPAPFNTTIDYVATGRGRLGYAMGTWMPYAASLGEAPTSRSTISGPSCRRSATSPMSAGRPDWA